MSERITITAAYDSLAGAWWVEHSSLSGLNAEGETLKEFRRNATLAAQSLLDTKDEVSIVIDVPDRYGQFR